MKLRIHGDSIRFRLRKPDVRQLLDTGAVVETTAFSPESSLVCRLEIGGEMVRASFESGELKVRVPRAMVKTWADTDQIGISADQPNGNGGVLKILIEKDFACRDGENAESQEGAYENPLGTVC
jgi:hypothetical protein